MRAPDNLGAAGKAAWAQAKTVINEQTAPADRFAEAAKRFARAVDTADRLNREWAKKKRPLLAKGGATGKADVPHPLIRMIAEAERDAAKFGSMLGLDPKSRKELGSLPGRPQERVPERAAGEPAKVVPLRAAG